MYSYRPQTKLREDNVFTPVCVCVHREGGGGGLCPGGPCPEGSVWGSLSGGLSLGGLCPGGLCPVGVSVQGVSVQRVSVRGVPVQGVLCPGGVCLVGLCHGNPPYSNERAVRILLECILVKSVFIYFLFITTHKRSLGQGNIFSSVCQEFCPQGGLPQCMLGYHSPQQTPPDQTHTPGADTSQTRHPVTQCILEDMVNKRAVCILLECNLVLFSFFGEILTKLFTKPMDTSTADRNGLQRPFLQSGIKGLFT